MDDRPLAGVASSALFDPTDSDAYFRAYGVRAYTRYQDEHLEVPLALGPAFPFVELLPQLDDLRPGTCWSR